MILFLSLCVCLSLHIYRRAVVVVVVVDRWPLFSLVAFGAQTKWQQQIRLNCPFAAVAAFAAEQGQLVEMRVSCSRS